ncbi:MAG TPA: 50S ribosomal protein L3 [Cyanobacteria bacterium UBA8530]|nr:50S ribosomal protein L3 [Cyanobacteria bacterium UBA8530]
MLGLIGRKLGMTQVFDPQGQVVPVSVIQAGPCTVTQIKTMASEGYNALQIGFGDSKTKHLTKGQQGHLEKAGKLLRTLREFRFEGVEGYQIGQELKADLFTEGQLVDVIGTSIGKGFAGMMKRHHSGRGPMAHGSKFHRHPGSIGAGTTPGRVYKGASMPGHLGNERTTVRRLQVIRVDVEKNVMLIKGAIPGAEGGLILIRPAVKVGK